ncbi:ABC transporter substrate-binding protein [Cellulosilyticum ruminicola]|uniref:ABC transporter substrate-binding protein n=1 Tax=Cellulosilyticum ruminicola TaxID=425254 RepID=UPI0006D09365|nr:ABC transporter substrate-binding protein [Cellulosilyticum ruminicola]
MKQSLLRKMMILMAAAMSFVILVGCSSTNNTQNVIPTETAAPEVTTAPESTFNVSVTDSTGQTTTLTSVPKRIVSLAPSTTEILAAVGVENKIVGRTDYCNYPETIETITTVGGTMDPNVETIISLEPDLVVGSTHVSDEIINKLRDVGIPVVFLNEQEGFDGTYEEIRTIGNLVDELGNAEKVIDDMKANVTKITDKVKALNKTDKPKVYYMIGSGESDYTAGGDTFISEMINLVGGQNIAQNISGWSISKEQIADNQPDIIIVPSGVATLETLKNANFYKDLEAVKAGKVYEINGDMVSRQGPREDDALIEMAEIINPELKNN